MERDKRGRFLKGFKHTKASKKIISNRMKGKNHPMYGKHHSKKSKIKMRNAKIDKPSSLKEGHHTNATKKKMSKSRNAFLKQNPMALSGKNNPMFGKHHTTKARKLISKGNSKPKAHLLCKHHLDLNKKNNKPENLLILTNSKHRKLHSCAYNYLLKIGKIESYINWFDKEYGLK